MRPAQAPLLQRSDFVLHHQPFGPAATPHPNSKLAFDSTLIEKALEYQLTGSIVAALLRRGHKYEVLHGICDRNGYDVVIEAKGVIRHIQLKAVVEAGKVGHFDLQVALASKPSGCAIRIDWDPTTLNPVGYRFFGDTPNAPLPPLGDRAAKQSRGKRAERPNLRRVAAGKFKPVADLEKLVDRLFGREAAGECDILTAHMATTKTDGLEPWLAAVRAGDFNAIPEDLGFADAANLAELIDGYKLVTQLGYPDYNAFLNRQQIAASNTGIWPGLACDLWITLFLEFRYQRFAGLDAAPDMRLLDLLVKQLRQALAQ